MLLNVTVNTAFELTSLQKFLEFATAFNPYQEALFDLLSSTLELLIPNDTDLDPYL